MTSRGVEVLTTDECQALLRAHTFGRVAVRIGESPAILPVNYAVLDEDVVFRTDPGSKWSAAIMRVLVAFEIDEINASEGSGWSVVVSGYFETIRDVATLERVSHLDLDPWGADGHDFVVRIKTRSITGRRLVVC